MQWVNFLKLKFLPLYATCCSVLSVHLTSAKSLVGVAGVASEIQKEKKVIYYKLYVFLYI